MSIILILIQVKGKTPKIFTLNKYGFSFVSLLVTISLLKILEYQNVQKELNQSNSVAILIKRSSKNTSMKGGTLTFLEEAISFKSSQQTFLKGDCSQRVLLIVSANIRSFGFYFRNQHDTYAFICFYTRIVHWMKKIYLTKQTQLRPSISLLINLSETALHNKNVLQT